MGDLYTWGATTPPDGRTVAPVLIDVGSQTQEVRPEEGAGGSVSVLWFPLLHRVLRSFACTPSSRSSDPPTLEVLGGWSWVWGVGVSGSKGSQDVTRVVERGGLRPLLTSAFPAPEQ